MIKILTIRFTLKNWKKNHFHFVGIKKKLNVKFRTGSGPALTGCLATTVNLPEQT